MLIFQPHRLVDVSQNMDAFCFHGDPIFKVKGPFNRVEGPDPEYVYDFSLCSQSGTHIQGAHYFLEDGDRIESYPLESFEGPARIVNMPRRGEDTQPRDLEALIGGEDLSGRCLILRTGHMDEVIASGGDQSLPRPGLSREAARYLAEEKRIKLVGIDSYGLESRISLGYPVNRYLGSQGVLILEGLVNLDRIEKEWVWLEAFPLKIRGVEGTPCRAVVREPLD